MPRAASMENSSLYVDSAKLLACENTTGSGAGVVNTERGMAATLKKAPRVNVRPENVGLESDARKRGASKR